MQPDHPPYPRPVPYIDADEDIVLPGAVVIFEHETDEGFDADRVAAKRAAKRRRIQQHAHSYLRGEGISILSSGLRGPFDNDWANPWSRNNDELRSTREQKTRGHGVHKASSNIFSSSLTSDRGNNVSVRTPVPATALLKNPFQRVNDLLEPPHSNEKVEGWLRRNGTLLPQADAVAPPSPTPKERSSPIQSRQAPKNKWTPTKQLITVNSQDIRAPINEQPIRAQGTFGTDDESSEELAFTSKQAHSRLQEALHNEKQQRGLSPMAVAPKSLAKSAVNADRAEMEILRLKRHAVEDISSIDSDKQAYSSILFREIANGQRLTQSQPERNSLATPPVSDPEQIEEGPRAVQALQEIVKPSSTNVEICSQTTNTPWKRALNVVNRAPAQTVFPRPVVSSARIQTSGTVPPEAPAQLPKPTPVSQAQTNIPQLATLSTAASDIQPHQLLPSAQRKPELQAMPSNTSSSLRLLEALSTAVSFQQQQQEEEEKEEEGKERKSEVEDEMPGGSKGLLQAVDNELVDNYTKDIGGKGPLENVSVHPGDANSRSPQTKPRRKGAKTSKRASFVPEVSSLSSNESIRSVLKIGKSNAVSSGTLKSPPPSLSKVKLSMDELEAENSPPGTPIRTLRNGRQVRSPVKSSTGRKGILKTTSTPSLASRQNVQIPGLGDDDFDLNGAIDELGSFLSTWDAEKDGLKVL